MRRPTRRQRKKPSRKTIAGIAPAILFSEAAPLRPGARRDYRCAETPVAKAAGNPKKSYREVLGVG